MKSIRPLSALLVCAALYGQSVSALAAADLTLTAPTEAVPGGCSTNSASPSETSAVHSPSPRRLLSRLTSTMRTIRRMAPKIRRMAPKTPAPRLSPLTKNLTQRIRRTNSLLLKSLPFSPARLPPAISSTPHLLISRSVKKGIKSASASAIRFLRTTQAIGLWMLPPAMRKSGLL